MNLEQLTEYFRLLPADLRMEAILCELAENGLIDLEQLRVHSLGIFHRNYRRDLEGFEAEQDELGQFRRTHVHVWREGIYDALPSGLFHGTLSRKYLKNAKEIREDVERQQQEEQAARNFFLPIEQEFYRQRLLLELEEREVLAGYGREEGQQILRSHLWEIEGEPLPGTQEAALLYFLPLAFVGKGDLPLCQEIFQIVLQKPVSLSIHFRSFHAEAHDLPSLGQGYLGHNFVLGTRCPEIFPQLRFDILGIHAEEMEHYLPGRPQARLAERLCDYFLPAESDVSVTPHLLPESSTFVLGEASGNAWLGYSTLLS